MSRKPDRITAMQQIIDAVKQEFPLYQPDTFKCGRQQYPISGQYQSNIRTPTFLDRPSRGQLLDTS
ncbi:hypothetical protein [Aeromonas salmonicida]|uniref:hypothetical protein n=1 Tax=Aeromonas salmonicida TaxID=645 RepID=UPI001BA93BC0|nr:hypothetical protein [Aeromonas salmonicida]MBS2782306.1 hypothetical protein [Aeromonas salmonicida]